MRTLSRFEARVVAGSDLEHGTTSIVFEHLSDLHQCVRAILSDPDCQV